MSARNSKDQIIYGCRFMAVTEGKSFTKVFERFKAEPAGQRLLANRPPFYEMLRDPAAMASAPPGSLARCYYEFLRGHGLEDMELDEELTAISRGFGETDEMCWFRHRYSVMHDLRHLLTDYGPDRAGEMCLCAFRYAQTGHLGLPILIVIAALGELVQFRPVVAAIREGYRRGSTTPLLDLCEWEAAPEQPLETFKQALGLKPPVHYRPSPAGSY